MNDYRITYTTEAGRDLDTTVTERTEAAARKYFNAMNKGLGFTVSDIQLIRENTCATKQQERDTLEAIKKMVAELGPQSYLATAFEGCFQDAEDNIDDDAAYSMKARWESAEQRIKELESKLRAAQVGINELVQKDDERKAALERMSALVLSQDDLDDVHQLLDAKVSELEEKAERAALEIVKYAEDPSGKEFRQAVLDNRNYSKNAGYYRELLGRVVAVEAAAHSGR